MAHFLSNNIDKTKKLSMQIWQITSIGCFIYELKLNNNNIFRKGKKTRHLIILHYLNMFF